MRILILEDNEIRIEQFKKLFKNQEITICSTIEEAKLACIKNKYTPFDALWLDHDLHGKIWENSFVDDTGYQFVKWMVDYGYQKNSLNYIHSMNPVGANLMLNYLKDNGYNGVWIPFHTLNLGD
jgi:DNA-binding NarL/FixJ family response regulator